MEHASHKCTWCFSWKPESPTYRAEVAENIRNAELATAENQTAYIQSSFVLHNRKFNFLIFPMTFSKYF